jgi:hypothetical protein
MKHFKGLATCILVWLLIFPSLIVAQPDKIRSFNPARSLKAAQDSSSNLPVIVINTDSLTIPQDFRIRAHMRIVYNKFGRNDFSGPFNEYDGNVSIEQRGSSSAWVSEKVSYSFETQNDTGGNLNISLIGLPEENDWILIGEYSDKTLIRNALAYELSRRAGMYASRTRFCELFLNNDYRGIYMLGEKIKRDNNRVSIATLNPDEIHGDDLTGGYILRIDRPDKYWVSPYKSPVGSKNVRISYYYPKWEDMPDEQRQYIRNFVTQFETALNNASFQDPLIGYLPYVNLGSFVDYFIFSELSKNIDAYRLSTFFYKDKDSKGGKLTMGPLWDINLGFGNANYYSGDLNSGWVINSISSQDEFQIPFWWSKLRQDPTFNTSLKLRWQQLRNNFLSEATITSIVDSLAVLLDEAQVRNFARWPILDQWVWPNVYVGGSYENEVQYLLTWIMERLQWMDNQINSISDLQDRQIIANSYEVYASPNPFTDWFTLRINMLDEGKVKIRIIDNTGKELITTDKKLTQGIHDIVFDADDLGKVFYHPGIYLYQIYVNGKMVRSEKIIKK